MAVEINKINVVCFGGGTGLPSLLSGLKSNPLLSITAIVNMFDSGGSSGELKDRFGILPPGDILKCLLALSDDEVSARKILLKRINNENFPGHTGGNLLLFALEKIYENYLDAISALSQILSVKGKVVPVTLKNAILCAEYTDGSIIEGEVGIDVGISEGKRVQNLFLNQSVDASEEAISSIQSADIICIGPGSFYTSLTSNFLPVGIKDAIMNSNAPIIFISNLLTEGKGMAGMVLQDFVQFVELSVGRKVSAVLLNKSVPSQDTINKYVQQRKYLLSAKNSLDELQLKTHFADLWVSHDLARHDSAMLSNAVYRIINHL